MFSVIIPTYRRPERLDACLASLLANDLGSVREILLVVHERDKRTLALARRRAADDPLFSMTLTGDASRGGARAAGVGAARGDWCYFLDDDVVLPPDALTRLGEALEAFPSAPAVGGPNLLPPGSGLFEACVDRVLRSRIGAGGMRARYEASRRGGPCDERALIGCNLAVSTRVLRRLNAFQEGLDYGEETLLLARMRREGFELVYAPDVRVYHHRRRSWTDFLRQVFRSGAGRSRQTRRLPSSLSWEVFGPPLLLLSVPAAVFLPAWAASAAAVYAALCLAEGAASGFHLGSLTAGLRVAALIPGAHAAYAFGMLHGALRREGRAGAPSPVSAGRDPARRPVGA